ncbi:hypothetical protein BJ742DRAFT_776794 [Cladochytrium replicatum]|nr:hypothetical protein BJ742DRAFT_776794 [Cladochytrium replicatum]
MHKNNMRTIPMQLGECRYIQQANSSQNQIAQREFPKTPMVTWLNLSENNIRELNLENYYELQHLEARGNKLVSTTGLAQAPRSRDGCGRGGQACGLAWTESASAHGSMQLSFMLSTPHSVRGRVPFGLASLFVLQTRVCLNAQQLRLAEVALHCDGGWDQTDCSNLFGGDHLCVSPSVVTTTTSTTMTTTISTTITATSPSPSPSPTCVSKITVVSGDSCSSLITQNKIYAAQLYALNPTLSGTSCPLAIGQIICLADSQVPLCKTTATGSSCSNVATAAGISLQTLYSLNPFLRTNCIATSKIATTSTRAATTTLSPVSQLPRTCTVSYTIKSCDTCETVANLNSLSLSTFLCINPTLNCATLSIGKTVCVGNGLTTCLFAYTAIQGHTCELIELNYAISNSEFLSPPDWPIGCIFVEFFTSDALFQTHDNLKHLAMMDGVSLPEACPFPKHMVAQVRPPQGLEILPRCQAGLPQRERQEVLKALS